MNNQKAGCFSWCILIIFFLGLAGAFPEIFIILISSVAIILIAGIIVKIKEQKSKKEAEEEYQSIEYKMNTIDTMNGQEFESFLINVLLPNEGYYKIKGTSYTGDYGVDIIAYKDAIKCAIQCKRFSNKVTNKAIQEVVAGRKHYKCEKAMVITNNYYTKNAQELAFDNQVQLLDRDDLIKMIKNLNDNNLIDDEAKYNII